MLNKITHGLLLLLLTELFLGGGGRLTAIGPISLRMILFSAAIVITIIHVARGTRVDKKYLQLMGLFTIMLMIGVTIGFMVGAENKMLWEDVKPLLFFYLLPFFSIAITTEEDMQRIGKIILYAAGIMAFLFLSVLTLFWTGAMKVIDFYNFANTTGEFFFRGEFSLFYKGFIYLCIGFLFAHLMEEKKRWWLLLIFSTAIVLSFTRGLIFALGLIYFIYYVFINRSYQKAIASIIICLLIFFYGGNFYVLLSKQLYSITIEKNLKEYERINGKISAKDLAVHEQIKEELLGDRKFSDNERKQQFIQVANATTLPSVVWGHGFGTGVESRPVHMEISYLEIFHKQGVIGIACWLVILFSLVKSYTSLSNKSGMSNAYFLAALFVFFQSLTNQYINNPIGLGMILISIVSLDITKKNLIK